MARVTQAEVGGIIALDLKTVPDITPFIDAANSLVTELLVAPATTLDDARLKLVELWLSAHFFAIRIARATLQKAGDVSQTLQSKVDLGFDVTHYGQMAMRLDTSGILARLNRQGKDGKAARTITIAWGGTAVT